MGCCGGRQTQRTKTLEIALLEDHGFVYTGRKFRDVIFAVIFLVYFLWIVGGGIYAVNNKNPEYENLLKESYLTDLANCGGIPSFTPSALETESEHLTLATSQADLQIDSSTYSKYVDTDAFAKIGYEVLGITAVGSILIGMAFVGLFSFCPWVMVTLTLVCMCLVPASAAVYYFIVVGTSSWTIYVPLIVAAILVLVLLCCLYSVFPLVVKLLDKASDCLVEQPGMILMNLILMICSVVIIWPMLYLMMVARMNGQIVEGGNVCKFQVDTWAQVYFWTAIVFLIWAVMLTIAVKTYFVSGAAAQWYFNNEDPPAWSPTILSMKWALTKNFGSLCISSFVLTVLTIIRSICEYIRRENQQNILMRCLCCIVNCILSCIAELTRFATIYMAITGDSFIQSTKGAVALLSRNALNSFGVWWLPDFILYCAAILMAVSWGLLSYGLYKVYDQDNKAGDREDVAIQVGVIAGVESLVILLFFVFILLNVVDSLYVAMAFDKDANRVKRADVHDVYESLPGVKKNMEAAGPRDVEAGKQTDHPADTPII